MSAFYDLNKTPRNILNQAIVRAIISENNGALFDPSDLSTLYQDAAGTIPVTAVEQPVGKMLDKSGNGYYATQPITASRPTLSARYNLLTKTEDFADEAWVKNSVAVSSSQFLSPIGTLTANKVTPSSGVSLLGNNVGGAFCSPVITANGTTYTLSIYAKSAGSNYIRFRESINTGQRVKVNLTDGSFVGEAGWVPSTFTISVSQSTNGFYLIKISRTAPTKFGFNIKAGNDTGDGVNGVYVWGIDLRAGSSITAYQRVNTSTDYDTDERYFPKYLKFDAVDDYLNLPFMNLYGGGAVSIICARDAVSQATDAYIISERSTTDIDPKYFPSRQLASAGNMDTYITDDAGAVVLDTVGSQFSGVANAVIRSIVDSGNNLKLFKDGVLAANDNYTRSGTLTLNNTTIGASASTTTSNYASMKLYGLIITKSALTDAQRIACERYLGRKSGVTL
jgi:hypothetical protein